MKTKLTIILSFTTAILFAQSELAPKFDLATMQFKGTKTGQAKYLLRKVNKYGNLGTPLESLPNFLNEVMSGNKTVVDKKQLKKYLTKHAITDAMIGGNLNDPLAKTSNGITANYIVFHDVSHLIPNITSFPENINTAGWRGNNLQRYNGFKNAHLFINRIGESYTSNNFSKTIIGTKFESKTKNPSCGGANTGNFIHIELIQPRMADPGKKNDGIAPVPGFTESQYTRVALVYIAASSRKSDWLIPVFHAVIDKGIPDAHDDPQNFDLDVFSEKLATLYNEIESLR
ncbi:hypothetical protein [Flavobacterium sp.]